MNQNELQDRISFYRDKIALCHKIKAEIYPDDPYRDIKRKMMDRRIRIYNQELRDLHADDLTRWS